MIRAVQLALVIVAIGFAESQEGTTNQCPIGMEFNPTASACPATCEDRDAPKTCPLDPVPACECDSGRLQKNNLCVDRIQCTCKDPAGEEVPIRSTWLSADCTTRYTCRLCPDCTSVVSLKDTPNDCSGERICIPDGFKGKCIKIPTCRPTLEFIIDNSACPATCESPDAPTSCTEPPVAECGCPKDKVFIVKTCEDPRECNCVDDSGLQHKQSESWLAAQCDVKYQCIPCEECAMPVGRIEEEKYECPEDQICAQNGTCIDIPECPENMEFVFGLDQCPPTCDDDEGPDNCPTPSVPGCTCLKGLVWLNGGCTDPKNCDCVDEDGVKHKQLESWLSTKCDREYTCSPCKNCALPVGKIEDERFECGEGTMCALNTTCIEIPECPGNMEFSLDAIPCPPTCEDAGAARNCVKPKGLGCACKKGLVWANETCVDPKNCNCIDDDGVRREQQETWLTEDCHTKYTCDACTSCALPVGKIRDRDYRCPSGTKCRVPAECRPVTECPESQTYEFYATGCPSTCDNPEAPLHCNLSTIEGCVCREGRLLNDSNICVTARRCGCKYAGNTFEVNSPSWHNSNCTRQFKCRSCTDCYLPVGKIEDSPSQCPFNRICWHIDEAFGECRPTPPCPSNMLYNVTATDCPGTCDDPDTPGPCNLTELHGGCVCPHGMLIKNGSCLAPSQCYCTDEFSTRFEIGDVWIGIDCLTRYECNVCHECSIPMAVIKHYPIKDLCRGERTRCATVREHYGECKYVPYCPPGFVYSFNKPGCTNTCSHPTAEEVCDKTMEEGCVCPNDLLYKDHTCIKPWECGCYDENENHVKVGDEWLSPGCSIMYKCTECRFCRPQINMIKTAPHSCDVYQRCVKNNYGHGYCMDNPGPIEAAILPSNLKDVVKITLNGKPIEDNKVLTVETQREYKLKVLVTIEGVSVIDIQKVVGEQHTAGTRCNEVQTCTLELMFYMNDRQQFMNNRVEENVAIEVSVSFHGGKSVEMKFVCAIELKAYGYDPIVQENKRPRLSLLNRPSRLKVQLKLPSSFGYFTPFCEKCTLDTFINAICRKLCLDILQKSKYNQGVDE